ncbi:MAG: glucan phosphoethanolaminetransferase (alkaline phosphatase superfamily) [Rickettsiales bacterium]|jgi:glucan phosphoethanolaminetransferase (alkaline phosphatase superfamily)
MKTSQFEKGITSQFCWANIFGIFAIISILTRTVFLVEKHDQIDFSLILIAKIYLTGLLFDFITLTYLSCIPLLYYILVPSKFFTKKFHNYFILLLYFSLIYGIIFSAFAEWFFWTEFSTRFNLIAAYYLTNTTELISNIVETYPVAWISASILVISAVIFFSTYKNILENIRRKTTIKERFQLSLAPFLICIIVFFTIDSSKIASKVSGNLYAQELSYNGVYQLFSSYLNHQSDSDGESITKKTDKIEENFPK